MSTDEVKVGTIIPGEIPVWIEMVPELGESQFTAILERLQAAWIRLPDKVRQVTQRHPGYSIHVRNLNARPCGNRKLLPVHGEWKGYREFSSIAIHPMGIFEESNGHFGETSWLEVILTHELYGHGIGSHSSYSEIIGRYEDYIMAPNPWLRFALNRGGICASHDGVADLTNWVRHQINCRDNSVPWRLGYPGYVLGLSTATSLLVVGGRFPNNRWQNIWPATFRWRTVNNVATCASTWRDAWLTPDAILPSEVIDESLRNVFEELGIYDIPTDDYWRSLMGQDQLVRDYSARNTSERLAEHLTVGVLGLAGEFRCERVCHFLESVTDIILNEVHEARCFCGGYIYNSQSKFCGFHEGLHQNSFCSICGKEIDNPFGQAMCNFIGVCDDERCQKITSNVVEYRRMLVGGRQNGAKHYVSLEKVPARELEIGNRIILWSETDEAHPLQPETSPSIGNVDLQHVVSAVVETVCVADDVTTVSCLGYGEMKIANSVVVMRSQLPSFRLMSALEERTGYQNF